MSFLKSSQNLFLFLCSIALLALGYSDSATEFLSKTPYILPAFAFRLLSFSLSLLMLGSFYGLGGIASLFINLKPLSSGLQHIIRFFLGYVFAGSMVYLLGLLQLLNPVIFIFIFILGLYFFFSFVSLPSQLPSFSHVFSSLSRLEKWCWSLIGMTGLLRLCVVLNFNSFGDPLFYTLPSGRDYLRLGGFQWIEHAELYFQAGFSDLLLIYLHSISSNALLVQLTAQSFYYLIGPVLLFLLLHFEWFSLHLPKQHSLWLSFSFAAMGMFRLESVIAKADYLLVVLLFLLLLLIHRLWRNPSEDQKIALWKSILLIVALSISIKNTSVFYLLPLLFAILFLFNKNLPIFNQQLRGFLAISLLLSGLNSLKNGYIYKNPVFPFANQYFKSPYWGDTYIMSGVGSIKSNGVFEMTGNQMQILLSKILFFFNGNYTVLFLSLMLILYCFTGKSRKRGHEDLRKILLLLVLGWGGSILLWVQLLPVDVYPRYVIGSVYLTLIIPAVGSFYLFREPLFSSTVTKKQHAFWQYFAYFSLLLTLSNSHVDVDLNKFKATWLNPKSLYQQWIDESDLAELQDYLNQRVSSETLVLFYFTSQRFHSNFIAYAARWTSPRTKFVYSNNERLVEKGLTRINPAYFVIPKSMINQSSLLSQKEYLAQKFKFQKEFRGYLLYQSQVKQ